ncbi:MAG: ferrochelatase [Planctomycetota bacterium]|jgi:ferrochelatase
MPTSTQTGVLLVNLGTPDAPRKREVRRYLREFLSDPRVLDLSILGRTALLYGAILPFRPKRAAAAYREIWGPEGSPLLTHSKELRAKLEAALPGVPIELAMRYGRPDLPNGLKRLMDAGCDQIVVLPLYPQYASSSTGSTVEAVYRLASKHWNTPHLRIIPPFFADPGYISSMAAVARPILDEHQPDHVLLSYHGLPVRHVQKSSPNDAQCGLDDGTCCATLRASNRNCYRAQCIETSRLLRRELGLVEADTSITFQSRLGRTPWIRPYTDQVIPELARRGVKRLAVLEPSFVADCLETLEEIGQRAKADFLAAGGEELILIPSLNAHPSWVQACVQLLDL